MKWVMAMVCLLFFGFCVFGLLATFEPGVSNAIPFRLGYAVIGLACLAGIVLSLNSFRER